jgi:hypothetical protein
MDTEKLSRNERLLQETPDRGFLSELLDFMKTSRKWWMLPILVLMLLFWLALVMGNSAVAPFLYPLF